MDPDFFDRLKHDLGTPSSRQGALRLLAGSAMARLLTAGVPQTAASKHRKKRKKRRSGASPSPAPQTCEAQTCCYCYGFGLDNPYNAFCSTEFTNKLDCFHTCQLLTGNISDPLAVFSAEYAGEPGTRNVCNDLHFGGCTTVCGP